MQLTGAFIVCACTVFIGVLLAKKEKDHLKACEEILYVMRYIRDDIWAKKTPTSVIFSSLSSPLLHQAGFYRHLKENGDLYNAARECCFFQEKELSFIKEFSFRIGKTASENQKNEFNIIIEKMEVHTRFLRDDLPKKQKLHFALPAFFGLLAVIVFI